MNLSSNDFELFGLPETFAQDAARIEARWKELQRETHPDRFASQGAAAQRVAMQWSVRINEAHGRLRHPLKRAAYLCELRGAPIGAEDNTAMPAAFLMQQMEWREALDEAADIRSLDALADQVTAARDAALEACRKSLDEDSDPQAAARQVRALMFIQRFGADVEERIDRLGQ